MQAVQGHPPRSSMQLDGLAPDVRRDLHRDAVVLNRKQLWVVLAALVLLMAAVTEALVIRDPRFTHRTLGAAIAFLIWAGRTCREWWRLRHVNPDEYE